MRSVLVFCSGHDVARFVLVLVFNVYRDDFKIFKIPLRVVYDVAVFISYGLAVEFDVEIVSIMDNHLGIDDSLIGNGRQQSVFTDRWIDKHSCLLRMLDTNAGNTATSCQ